MLREALAILASTPDKLRREITEMAPKGVKTRPAPNKWSAQEVLAHLNDVEKCGMRDRVEMIVTLDRPTLTAFDQEARAATMKYNRIDPFTALEHFTRQRRANVRWLRGLRPSQLERKGMHATVGEMSAEEFVYEWAFHDLGHLRQILEIRRYSLFPLIGNMRAFYKLS